jgi:hypothetical protein
VIIPVIIAIILVLMLTIILIWANSRKKKQRYIE